MLSFYRRQSNSHKFRRHDLVCYHHSALLGKTSQQKKHCQRKSPFSGFHGFDIHTAFLFQLFQCALGYWNRATDHNIQWPHRGCDEFIVISRQQVICVRGMWCFSKGNLFSSISVHILLTVVHIFQLVLVGRMFFTIKTSHIWWSIISFILVTCMFDQVVIMKGEIRCLSLTSSELMDKEVHPSWLSLVWKLMK